MEDSDRLHYKIIGIETDVDDEEGVRKSHYDKAAWEEQGVAWVVNYDNFLDLADKTKAIMSKENQFLNSILSNTFRSNISCSAMPLWHCAASFSFSVPCLHKYFVYMQI